jgi:hypothetical protein
MVVVLGLDDSDRNTELLIEYIIRKFLFLLVTACDVSANDHRAGRKRDLAPDLSHRIPPCVFDRGRDKEITNIDFAKLLFVEGLQSIPQPRRLASYGIFVKSPNIVSQD